MNRERGDRLEMTNILQEMKNISREIDCLQDEIKKLREECDGLRATDYSAPKVEGGTPSGIVDRVIKLEDRIEKLKKLINKRYEYVDMINTVLDKMPTVEYALLIRNRYLYGETWGQIGKLLHTNRETARNRMHKEALKEFQKYCTDCKNCTNCKDCK